ELINKRNTELKLSFIQQITKDLKKGSFQEKEIIKKLEQLKAQIIQLKSGSSAESLLD
ncbi:8690_t:CDS:1, partial [Racocetra persica]